MNNGWKQRAKSWWNLFEEKSRIPPPLAESAKESLQALEALGDALSKAQLTRQNALKEVASVRENVEKEMQRWGQNPAIKRMQQAARSPSGNLSPSQATQMQQQVQDMEENLGAQEGLKDELETLQKGGWRMAAGKTISFIAGL